jgi:hypothetical protein
MSSFLKLGIIYSNCHQFLDANLAFDKALEREKSKDLYCSKGKFSIFYSSSLFE